MNWLLSDATKLRLEYPYTFSLPDNSDISLLTKGDLVKVIFEKIGTSNAERLWIEIKQRHGSMFVGVLKNTPVNLNGLNFNDVIKFTEANIIEIQGKKNPGMNPFWNMTCLVNRKIIQENVTPENIYLDDPIDNKDSGWVVLTGRETSSELQDSNNFQYISIGAVLNCHPFLEATLKPASTRPALPLSN